MKVQRFSPGIYHRRRAFQMQKPSISEAGSKRATRLAGLAELIKVVISTGE
ncbi:uncharacterized protein PgNI_02679 [Pyricularia grisea]|uniref:Uncharacterized protein n=1 Tax=Pyricularia grisea TaxID=148305 RepID=A0A6P8BE14_PYRGI|nr:uncharacterized protein PgNI_02679 [Pyricularia grisea]TLD14121.1 hypothetical protein PgNI_02679 [Pyricularia grisea]